MISLLLLGCNFWVQISLSNLLICIIEYNCMKWKFCRYKHENNTHEHKQWHRPECEILVFICWHIYITIFSLLALVLFHSPKWQKRGKEKFQWHIHLGEHNYEYVTSRLRSTATSAQMFGLLFNCRISSGAKSFKSIYNYAVTLKETHCLQSSAAQWCAFNFFFFALATRWGYTYFNHRLW